MPRFRISTLLLLTAIVAGVLLLSLKVPVEETLFVPYSPVTGQSGIKTVTQKRVPTKRESGLRVIVWMPWAVGAWAGIVYLRKRAERQRLNQRRG